MFAFIHACVGQAGLPLSPHANVFGPAAAPLVADAGCVFPAEPADAAAVAAGSAGVSAGAADAAAVAAGAGTDDAAGETALGGAGAALGSDLEQLAERTHPRANAHTSRQAFICFLSRDENSTTKR
jgi:hypothetical protein